MNPLELSAFPHPAWRPLLRRSAFLSAVMLLLIPVQMAIFTVFPPPDTVEGFFALYRANSFLGLLSLDLIYLLNNVILIVIYLSLTACLFAENRALALTALALGLVGIACYFPSNPAFEMLNLSQRYGQALPEAQARLLAAGEALLARYRGTAFDAYYILNALALLLYSKALWRSPHFRRALGGWGFASGILMLVPSSAGTVGLVFSLLSLAPWAVFLLLLIRALVPLSRQVSADAAAAPRA